MRLRGINGTEVLHAAGALELFFSEHRARKLSKSMQPWETAKPPPIGYICNICNVSCYALIKDRLLRVEFKSEPNKQPAVKVELPVLPRTGQLPNGAIVAPSQFGLAHEEKRCVSSFGEAPSAKRRIPQCFVERRSRLLDQFGPESRIEGRRRHPNPTLRGRNINVRKAYLRVEKLDFRDLGGLHEARPHSDHAFAGSN